MQKKAALAGDSWQLLINELTSVQPKMEVIHSRMKSLGLRTSDDLVVCMERTLAKMESLESHNFSKKQGADHEF